ncbi:MAG: class IV adenylate cyclase [Acidobacteria bacterium]|nr:class IV adenylate cyclase [Acidobacteriota bacterium]
MREIEIKLPVAKSAAVRRRIRGLGFEPLGPRLLERNLVFDTPDETLRQSQQLLRLRSKGGRWWLTFKSGPAIEGRHKVREEIELELFDGEAIGRILEQLGYRPAFEYHKYRTEYQQPGHPGHLLLDHTPIGDFVELEGPPRWIDRVAAQLGYNSRDYITASYAALYFEWCRAHNQTPGNMVF